ncbi:hypothetical protein CEP81_11800 [Kocuria rhizophila]|nr:hypothetical protein CEP81_11800 [Kocuria rhizophila]
MGVGLGVAESVGVGLGVLEGVWLAKSAGAGSSEPPVRPVNATAPTPASTSRAAPPRAAGARNRRAPERDSALAEPVGWESSPNRSSWMELLMPIVPRNRP